MAVRLGLAVLAGALVAMAQPNWRKVGDSSVELQLAAPAGGPVKQVWFAEDGSLLYARTASGKTFQTLDFETWDQAPSAPAPTPVAARNPVRVPDPQAAYFSLRANSSEVWGVGRQLFRSSDDGRSWETLTSYRNDSVIGPGLHDLALSPLNPDELVVANDYGVWRSMDGGLTWAGLNGSLPNLAVQRILGTPIGSRGVRVLTQDLGTLELPPGAAVWQLAPGQAGTLEAEAKRAYSAKTHAEITAFARSADGLVVYAGSADGRIWKSVDEGGQFEPVQTGLVAAQDHAVQRIFVDPAAPDIALAVFGGSAPHVVRTFNGGNFWDVLDNSSLPNSPANAVTVDRAAGAVYVATDAGVFWTRFDLETGAVPSPVWKSLSEGLPSAKAVDVLLDPAGNQLYAALEGYGVYATRSPHRSLLLRLVNAADYSSRPAAPGSLVSVVGDSVTSASAGAAVYPVWNSPGADSQIQVPFDAVGPMVSLALQTASGRTLRDLAVLPVSPAILVTNGLPTLFDADSGMALERNAAHPSQRIQVMLTGLGKVRPEWKTGQPAPAENPPAVVATVRAFLDGHSVQVTSAALAPLYTGLYLVELQLPPLTNYGAMELYITADNQESNRVRVVVEP